jgi:SynChlorMet cassette radical SAM/SPASM protein ScmF
MVCVSTAEKCLNRYASKKGKIEMTDMQLPQCGFSVNTIYFYLTEGCNLRCRHCWLSPTYEGGGSTDLKKAALDLDLFKKICREGKEMGMGSVKLTGGEPLMHPQIGEILDFIKEEGLRVIVETNGVLCTPELAEKIAAIPGSFASISLDSPDEKIHEWVRGVEGSFNDALKGAENLVAVGKKPQFIMSIMQKNKEQIEDLVKLAIEKGAGSVKFNLIMPVERGQKMHDNGETLPIEELLSLGNYVEKELQKKYPDIRLSYTWPYALRSLDRLMGDNPDLGKCGILGIIGVLANGKYALCGVGENIEELIFGDAQTDPLADVWNNSTVLNDIRHGFTDKLGGVCGDCLHKSTCYGSCIANNYYRARDLYEPFWLCQDAFDAGLFPASRLVPGSTSDKILQEILANA